MAEVCSCCDEIFWTEEDVAVMEKKAKEKGIWGRAKSKIAVAGICGHCRFVFGTSKITGRR